jgi:Nidogen-like/PEP-CTERM motif
MKKFNGLSAILIASAAMLATSADAATLRSGLGGPADYGVQVMNPNDDGSSNALELPFTVDFFGNSYSSIFVNNNGNISFGQALGAFTPVPFGSLSSSFPPIIAPFWADVDTRCGECGAVYAGSSSSNSFTVTWNNVGYFSNHGDKLNNFQMTFVDQGSGDFDIEFLYEFLNWSTGDASNGANGLGGIPAQAGYDAGNGNFFTLPGSFLSPGVLNLANTTNVTGGDSGEWLLKIRDGDQVAFDGSTPNNPLLPTDTTEDGFSFTFDVGNLEQRVWIDPLVATGYDYLVTSGPNILSAIFPELGDPDGYEVYAFDAGGALGALLGTVGGNTIFNFGAGGVSGFALRGIDTALGLDPANTTAFVTGLTFDVAGPTTITLQQNPVSTFVSGGVPEPATWAMMMLGFGAAGGMMRYRRRKTSVSFA